MRKPFGFFNSLPEIIRLAVMMYARYHFSLRQVEDLTVRTRQRYQPRNRSILVEPVRPVGGDFAL